MNKTTILTFRADIPTATAAAAPVKINLNPPARAIHEIELYFLTASGATHDVGKAGWRARNNGRLILPENGSDDDGFILGANEAGWAGMPYNDRVALNFHGYELSGPPYDLTFEFYNVEGHAMQAIGFVTVRDPEYHIHDLVIALKAWQEQARPVIYDPNVKADPASQLPPYGAQQIKK